MAARVAARPAAGVPAQAPAAVVPVGQVEAPGAADPVAVPAVPVEDSVHPDNAGIHDPVSCLGLCRHPSHPEPLDKIHNGKKDL